MQYKLIHSAYSSNLWSPKQVYYVWLWICKIIYTAADFNPNNPCCSKRASRGPSSSMKLNWELKLSLWLLGKKHFQMAFKGKTVFISGNKLLRLILKVQAEVLEKQLLWSESIWYYLIFIRLASLGANIVIGLLNHLIEFTWKLQKQTHHTLNFQERFLLLQKKLKRYHFVSLMNFFFSSEEKLFLSSQIFEMKSR